MITQRLFTNQTSNGFSEAEQLVSGGGTLIVVGTFDGAILKSQVREKDIDGSWTDWTYAGDTDDLFEGKAWLSLRYLQQTQFRYELTSAGASTDITLIFNI